jgi:hypothetical protein
MASLAAIAGTIAAVVHSSKGYDFSTYGLIVEGVII